MRLIFLFLFAILASTSASKPQPNLSRLFSRIGNCDLFLLRNENVGSDLSFQLFLPTTLWNFGIRGAYRHFDIAQFRVPSCKIVYAVDYPSFQSGILNGICLQPYKFRTMEIMVNIHFHGDVFPIISWKVRKLEWDFGMKQQFKNNEIEFLGKLRILETNKLQICWLVKNFKIQVDTQPCIIADGANTVLEMFQINRYPPREWFTEGKHLGLAKDFKDLDLATLKQSRNPMNREGKVLSVHLDHIQTVFAKDNASLIFNPDIWAQFFQEPKSFFDLGVGKFNEEILIFTEVGGYSFLTCYSESGITFGFYLTPFQPELWYALLAFGISLSLALSLYLHWRKIRTSFAPWMYVLGGLLEDGIPLPGKLENSLVFRLVFGCWIIVGVLLSNCFNGIMITELNAPLQASKINNFKDLVCDWQEWKYSYKEMKKNYSNSHCDFDEYFVRIERWLTGGNQTEYPYSSKNCFSLLSFPQKSSQIPEFFEVLFITYINYKAGLPLFAKKMELQLLYELKLNLFHPNQRLFPKNSTDLLHLSHSEWVARVEKEVVECGKTAVVLPRKLANAENEYFSRNYPAATFYQGKNILQPEPHGIAFKNPGVSKIPVYYKSLIETGIYERLNTEHYARANFRRKRAGKNKPLTDKMKMDGCISTLFIICAGFAGLAFLVFGAENFKGRVIFVVVAFVRKILSRIREKKMYAKSKRKPKQIAVATVVKKT